MPSKKMSFNIWAFDSDVLGGVGEWVGDEEISYPLSNGEESVRYLRADLTCGRCAHWQDMSCESPGNGECREWEYDYRYDHPACMDFQPKED